MASASIPADDAKPLVLILDDDDGSHVDEWLGNHRPSRLDVPVDLSNGTNLWPMWVLTAPSLDLLCESAPTDDPVFTKAGELVRSATAQVTEIQKDNNIPVHAGKIKSKKQCRTEVQQAFHDEIMLMTSDHPLWSQGKWTMLVRPSEIDRVFTQLVKSLASGDLKHSSIIALRARVLPSDEGATDSNKRSKTFQGRRTSNRSPTSSKQPQVMLGIDIFFRPVWDSNAAREVLRVVAGACGRMASFCKSSLYSRLGIKKDHHLGAHASLYNSKTLVSPADAKLWVAAYSTDGNGARDRSHLVDESPFKDASPIALSADHSESGDKETSVNVIKRPLEDATAFDAEKPAEKKARNSGNDDDPKQQPIHEPVQAASLPAEEAQSNERQEDAAESESQDEPMLPVRATSKPSTEGAPKSLSTVSEDISEQIRKPAPDLSVACELQEKLVKSVVEASQGKVVMCVGEETQTQEETFGSNCRSVVTEDPSGSKGTIHKGDKSGENELVASQEDADAEGESIEEEDVETQGAPQHTDSEQQPAVKAQEVLAAGERISAQQQPREASNVKLDPEAAAVSTGPSEEGKQDQPTVTAVVAAKAASQTDNGGATVSVATLSIDGMAVKSAEIDKGGCSGCNQASIAVDTTEKHDAAAKRCKETLGDTRTESEFSKATSRDSVADNADVIQDASDAHSRQAEATVALALPEGNGKDTLAEPNSVVESSIEAPAQNAAKRADHVQQAVDNDLPISAGNDASKLKAVELATSEPTVKPDESKAPAADHNGTNAGEGDGQAMSARGDGVEMSMDELIVESATAEPSISSQGGLEVGAK